MSEKDPNGIPAGTPGAKLDAGKPDIHRGVLQYFPRAVTAVAELSTLGARKYSWMGWAAVSDGINRYNAAMARHIAAEAVEGPYVADWEEQDIKVLHATAVAWNALAALELILKELEAEVPEPLVLGPMLTATEINERIRGMKPAGDLEWRTASWTIKPLRADSYSTNSYSSTPESYFK